MIVRCRATFSTSENSQAAPVWALALEWRCVLVTPGPAFAAASLSVGDRHDLNDALLHVLIGHIVEIELHRCGLR